MSYYTRLGWAHPVQPVKQTEENGEEAENGEKGKKKPFGGAKAKPFGQKRIKNKLKFVT